MDAATLLSRSLASGLRLARGTAGRIVRLTSRTVRRRADVTSSAPATFTPSKRDDPGVADPPTLLAHDGPNPASVARNIGPRRPAAPAVASRARVSVPGAKLPPRRPVS